MLPVPLQILSKAPAEEPPLAAPLPPETASGAEAEPDREPSMPIPRRTVIGRENKAFENALFKLDSQKLTSLYMSCVTLSLKDHTPLITVGLWSILETLASLHADKESKFIIYFPSLNIEQSFPELDRSTWKVMKEALGRISSSGNSTKHSRLAASFDGMQLANDFDVLCPFMTLVCLNMPK